MKRIATILCFFFLTAASAYAQSTTVSGQVTDSGGQSWNNGTVTAQFVPNPLYPTFPQYSWTGGALSPTVTGTLNGTGGYSFSIPSNTSITPVNSTWRFQFCPLATSQCFTTPNVSVTGGTQTVNATPPAISVPPTNGATAYADSEISAAAIGSTYYNTTSNSQRICNGPTSPCSWGPSGSPATANVVSPITFGAKWDLKAVTDASFTLNSNVVTCPNSDCNFTSADLGKIFQGMTSPWAMTQGCSGTGCGQVLIPQGFICGINNGNSINIGLTFPTCAADNATANCTAGAGTLCSINWATQDDTAAINAAALAAWGDGVHCYAVSFPSGMAYFHPPILNVTVPQGSPCNGTLFGDATQIGPIVYGTGPGTSVLVPLSGTTNFANCTAGNSGTACIAGPKNWMAHDWGVFGFGIADNGTTHNNNLIEFYGNPGGGSCTATAAWNMALNNWEAASAGTQGFDMNYGCAVLNASNVTVEAFGNTNCVALDSNPGNTTVNFTGVDCFGSSGSGTAGASLLITAQKVVSTGGWYWGNNPNAINAAVVKFGSNANAVFNSFGDHILGTANGNNTLVTYFPAGGNINLSGTTVETTNSSGSGNNYLFFCPAAVTCNISAYSSQLNASGTKSAMFNSGGTTNFKDACANNYTQGGVANSAINVFGSCSITGTTQTSGNIALTSGFGTGAAVSAVSGDSQKSQWTVTYGTTATTTPQFTITFPTPFLVVAPICTLTDVAGTNAFPTQIANGAVTINSIVVNLTFAVAPTSANTDIFQLSCR